jgi:hypothetical protein
MPDSVAQRVLRTCRIEDEGANLAYVGKGDFGETIVRIASSTSSSVGSLQRTLAASFPLARVTSSENAIDGSLTAQISVPSSRDEWRKALKTTQKRAELQALWMIATSSMLVGVGWALAAQFYI